MHTLEQLQNGTLAGTVRLQLSCGLTEFPREIFDLADTLEILDLSGNALTTLPDDLPRLTKLRVLFCSTNRFTSLPAMLGACLNLTMIGFKSNQIREVPASALPAALRWLILTDNAITALPPTIGNCRQLQKLMLAGNRLTALPQELAACTSLELLRIAANRLTVLPDWLLAMPQLTWLAYAGNPFSVMPEECATARIAWNRLRLQHQLGEGASGVISQALLRNGGSGSDSDSGTDSGSGSGTDVDTDSEHAVAVKLFKGAITSDGLPACELAACIGAGSHPNLIPVLGEISDHPDGVHGCVMALIDPAFGNLAGPPSLDSCTRDIYAAGKRFSLAALLRMTGGIAAAAQHLHSRGILHGDLYAHNILHTVEGDALLGDFGAASFFTQDSAHAAALQRLEVRAFGVLLGELMARCDDDTCSLVQLQRDCVQTTIAARPLFDDIAQRLAKLHRR